MKRYPLKNQGGAEEESTDMVLKLLLFNVCSPNYSKCSWIKPTTVGFMRSFKFFLLDERKLVAASWQSHGNQTTSYLKASVYPDHTTTQTQRLHIYPPQRPFLKSIVFSVGIRRSNVDSWLVK